MTPWPKARLELEAQAPEAAAKIRAVTFATQTNSFILLDAAWRPLTPLILWPDARAVDLEEELHRLDSLPAFTETTGVAALNRDFMAAKLLWLQRESPEIWKSAAKICLVSDYLTLLLTGQHVTEAGAAGLTGLLDIHACRWWPKALSRLDIPLAALPAVARAGSDLGPVSRAETGGLRLGLPPTCRVIVGCLDQYAGAIGSGNLAAGSVSETTGTVLATVRCADRFQPAPPPGVFQGPAFAAGLYYQMAFGEVAANYLEWYRNQLPDRPTFQRLAELAGEVGPDAAGLKLNTNAALAGGSSLPDVFVGLGPSHTPGHVVRCIMESVALRTRRASGGLVRRPPARRNPLGGRRRAEPSVAANQGRRPGNTLPGNALPGAHLPGRGDLG